jgi:SAM-dependent methyltransferase
MDKQEKIRQIIDPERLRQLEAKIPQRDHYLDEKRSSFLDLQLLFMRFPSAYAFVQNLLAPQVTFHGWKKEITDIGSKVVVNLGCGTHSLHPEMINVDFIRFRHVDIVADFREPLPICSESVDYVLSIAVFEHIRDPGFLAAEVKRILKPGGKFTIVTPFLYPFHAAPDDFSRWTIPGMTALLGDSFEVISAGNCGGPLGVILLAMAHACAQLLCFGSPKLYSLFNFSFMGLFMPLKFVDVIFANLPFASTLAPTLHMTAVKHSARKRQDV